MRKIILSALLPYGRDVSRTPCAPESNISELFDIVEKVPAHQKDHKRNEDIPDHDRKCKKCRRNICKVCADIRQKQYAADNTRYHKQNDYTHVEGNEHSPVAADADNALSKYI